MIRYTISLVSERYTNKKKTYKIVYRPFFVAVNVLEHIFNQENKCTKVFATDLWYVKAYPIKTKNKVDEDLSLIFHQ